MIIRYLTVLVALAIMSSAQAAVSQEPKDKQPAIIGLIFDAPVPLTNYYFVKSTLAVFGNRWGVQPQTTEQLEDQTWEQLVLSFEAFRRKITVSQQEVEAEIDRMAKDEKFSFDWKKDAPAFEAWVKQKTNEPVELFKNQISYLMQIQKLRDQVKSSIKPLVTEEETHRAFLDEQNHLELEIAQFEDGNKAFAFHQQLLKNQALWDEEKNKNPTMFVRPGMVTFAFLKEIWKFPAEGVNALLALKEGTVYAKPVVIYKGFGVVKVLGRKLADESGYASMKNAYFDRVALKKQYDGLNDWLLKLKQDANIKIYKQGG